jgi:hypothetical protein
MSGAAKSPPWKRRVLFFDAVGLLAFVLLFVVAVRTTVIEMFRGVASSKATGLSAISSSDERSTAGNAACEGGGASLEVGTAGDPSVEGREGGAVDGNASAL